LYELKKLKSLIIMKGLIDFEPDKFYHIVNHAVGNENIFRIADNYRYFLERYAHHTSSVFETYAYCLMPNHFHLLVRVKSLEELSQDEKFKGDIHKFVMQKISNLLNGYAKAYNIRFERKGALFIDFTKRFLVDSDDYFTAVVSYIHQNPIHHGFVNNLNDWFYSSYHSHLSNKNTKLKRAEVIDWFGNIDEFKRFHESNIQSLNPNVEY
jgi:putative transposase